MRGPSFVLLMADDQGFGERSSRGHPYLQTPCLDEMERAALSLERFYAAAPVCSPTRASVLTGRHPNRSGVLAWGHELPGRETTLAELLRECGYRTGHFGKWHLGSVHPDSPTSPGAQGFDTWLSAPNFFDLDPSFSREGVVEAHEGEGSLVVVEAALEFIREAREQGRPFLCVVWFGSPHLPHHGLPEDLEQASDLDPKLRAYAAEFRAMDRAVGRLRSELRRLELERDTLVWYTSDNGPRPPRETEETPEAVRREAASTAGLRGRKGTLRDGGLRVPSYVEWSGHVRPGRSEALSGTVDFFPTLLELAGVEVPASPTLDGTSLARLLSGEPFARPEPLAFWTLPVPGRVMHSEKILAAQRASGRPSEGEIPRPESPPRPGQGAAALIEGRWKLFLGADEGGAIPRLYDLEEDPGEERDLAPAHPERTERLRRALDRWQRSVLAEAPPKIPSIP